MKKTPLSVVGAELFSAPGLSREIRQLRGVSVNFWQASESLKTEKVDGNPKQWRKERRFQCCSQINAPPHQCRVKLKYAVLIWVWNITE
jgi:hypothetical protein